MTAQATPRPFSLDPLMAEAKRRARRRRLLGAVAGLAVAVGAYLLVVPHGGGGSAVPPSASPAYTTVAYVLHYPGSPSGAHDVACLDVPYSASACAGVPVTGYPFSRVAGRTRQQLGGWTTPLLRLTGTWNGHVFSVAGASPSKPARPAQPNCAAHETGPLVRPSPSSYAYARAEAQAQILEGRPCGHTYWFLVAAADQRTVSYLRRQFGTSVLVAGVLRPTRR
jgi:hypothetical protein